MKATPLPLVAKPRVDRVCEAVAPLADELPLHRFFRHGEATLSDAELVSLICDLPLAEARVVLGLGIRAISDRNWRVGPRDLRSRKRAARMAAALELGRRIAGQAWSEPAIVRTADDIARGLIARYGHKFQEHFVCVFLNSRNQVLCERVVYVGTMTSALVATREPIAMALQLNAVSIIACHNHPSGDPSPSEEDVKFTRKLYDACDLMNLELLDHVIVSATRHTSMKERGFFPPVLTGRFT